MWLSRCILPGVGPKDADGSPLFPGNPPVPVPCSSTPVGPDAPRHKRRSGAVPAGPTTRTPATNIHFEARSHGLSTGCLRFVPSSRTTTQNSLPGVANRCRVGLDTHRVPLSSFRFALPLLLGLSWRDGPAGPVVREPVTQYLRFRMRQLPQRRRRPIRRSLSRELPVVAFGFRCRTKGQLRRSRQRWLCRRTSISNDKYPPDGELSHRRRPGLAELWPPSLHESEHVSLMSFKMDEMAALYSLGASTWPHPCDNWKSPSRAES